jgi:hypothetical protein
MRSKTMEINKRRIGFRFNSVRNLLGLSLFELSRLLDRSHYTLGAIERSIRYPTDDLIYAIITLAAAHDMTVSYAWLIGEKHAETPTSLLVDLQENITVEGYIEACIIYGDDEEHRLKFGQRLVILIRNMQLTPFQFSKWAEVSADTVHKWLEGTSLPKKDTMRFIINKIKREQMPVSLEWLCAGIGVLEQFQYVPPLQQSMPDDNNIIHLTINSPFFEPIFNKNMKVSAYAYPTSCFLPHWTGFYLYCHEEQWIPVQLESTRQLNVFHVMSLHNRLSDRIFLKNVQCALIYPIVYTQKAYPVKLKDANHS